MSNRWVSELGLLNIDIPKNTQLWISYTKCISKLIKSKNFFYSLELKDEYLPTSQEEYYTRQSIGMINSRPCIYASIKAKYDTFLAYENTLCNLGANPIGESLFFKESFTRTEFYYSFNYNAEDNKYKKQPKSNFVNRKSLLIKNNYEFELIESFILDFPIIF